MALGLTVTAVAFIITALAALTGHLIDKGGDSESENA